MLVQSTDDPSVNFDHAVGRVQAETTNPEAVFRIFHDRKHNPNYTAEAAAYLTETFGAFNAAVKAGKCRTLAEKQRFFAGTDWARMTRQDEAFWDEAADFLRK